MRLTLFAARFLLVDLHLGHLGDPVLEEKYVGVKTISVSTLGPG